jgi:hypothetical protein
MYPYILRFKKVMPGFVLIIGPAVWQIQHTLKEEDPGVPFRHIKKPAGVSCCGLPGKNRVKYDGLRRIRKKMCRQGTQMKKGNGGWVMGCKTNVSGKCFSCDR